MHLISTGIGTRYRQVLKCKYLYSVKKWYRCIPNFWTRIAAALEISIYLFVLQLFPSFMRINRFMWVHIALSWMRKNLEGRTGSLGQSRWHAVLLLAITKRATSQTIYSFCNHKMRHMLLDKADNNHVWQESHHSYLSNLFILTNSNKYFKAFVTLCNRFTTMLFYESQPYVIISVC